MFRDFIGHYVGLLVNWSVHQLVGLSVPNLLFDPFYFAHNWCRVYGLFLGCSKTTKIHIIVGHLKEFCKKMGTGLLPYNEQAFESMHAKFVMYADGRLPKNPDHPSYGAALLKVVKELNVRHSH